MPARLLRPSLAAAMVLAAAPPAAAVVGLDPGALEAPCAVATPACRFDSRERVLRCA